MARHGINHARGWVLPGVLAILFLGAWLCLGMARQLWWQERLLRLSDEHLRNRMLAQALVQLAWQDLHAAPTTSDGSPRWRQQMGSAAQRHVFFPTTLDEVDVLRERLGSDACREGICLPSLVLEDGQAIANRTLSAWQGLTAQGMAVSDAQWPASGAQGWYWIELFVHADDLASRSDTPRIHCRITALVQGPLPGARALLQVIGLRDAQRTTPRGWLSWRWMTP